MCRGEGLIRKIRQETDKKPTRIRLIQITRITLPCKEKRKERTRIGPRQQQKNDPKLLIFLDENLLTV